MPDIIADTAAALRSITEHYGIIIKQGWYDADINATHITLWDLGETQDDHSDDEPESTTQNIQITIFSKQDETALAEKIKELMKREDFDYIGRNPDDAKPEQGIYMKALRYSKTYEMEET